MGHPNGRKPIDPTTFSPHTARQRAAKAAAKAAKAQRRAARKSSRAGSGNPWGKLKLLLMILPLLMALYVLIGLWTD